MIYLGQDPVGVSVMPDLSGKADKVVNATNGNFAALDSNGNLIDSGHAPADYVQNTDYASDTTAGVVKTGRSIGILSTGEIGVVPATSAEVKAGLNNDRAITPGRQHASTFYGLAKAAGDATQASSDNAVGTYTDAAKTAIQTMLGVESGVAFVEHITGTTPTITGIANTRYICGEVTSISITPPATGIIDVTFTSGTTPAVLTVSNTVTFPAWFHSTTLDANKVYEINIIDGARGVVATW